GAAACGARRDRCRDRAGGARGLLRRRRPDRGRGSPGDHRPGVGAGERRRRRGGPADPRPGPRPPAAVRGARRAPGPRAAGAAGAEEDLRTRALAPAARRLGGVASALTPRGLREWLQRWLDYAGNPPAWPPERIVETQGIGLLVGGALGGLLGVATGAAPTTTLGLLILGAAAGFAAP